ncbi:type II restriction endonuclease [Mycoplasma sp. ATU-Cv-508]|uniref:type II restriction endonuclease n=1 Tax=Mycoplasma sp. ATU-Cv-508 TaxID=2048001 RepID=UPI000FDED5D6
MALISERKANTESSGSYAIVLNDEKLAKLITAIHATSIANGNQLEKLVLEKTGAKTIKNVEELQNILNKNFDNQSMWVVPKKVVKRRWNFGKRIEPDFLVIQKDNETMYIIELKMGWVFDTKKVNGEWEQLKEFSNLISNSVSYKTEIFMCSFNSNSIDQIYQGFKGIIKKENLMTGKEFCSLMKINYEEIKAVFDNDAEKNLNFFIESILEIPKIRGILLDNLESRRRYQKTKYLNIENDSPVEPK